MKLSQYTIAFAVAAMLVMLSTTTASSYRHNYTCENGRNACSPNEDPQPIRWQRSCILFYMDDGGSNDFPSGPDGKPSAALEEILKESFASWGQPECSGLKPIYGGAIDLASQPVGERRNVVSFTQDGWSESSATTFATTIVNYHPKSGEIREADIEVNDQFYKFSTGSAPQPGEADLQNTLTHEVGHFLGMAHSDVEAATMFGSAGLGETKKRTLHRDDVDGLCAQYPADEYTGTCGSGSDTEEDGKADDSGSSSFTWGSDEEETSNGAACTTARSGVTNPASAATISPILLMMMGLFGGAWWRRRTRRKSGG